MLMIGAMYSCINDNDQSNNYLFINPLYEYIFKQT